MKVGFATVDWSRTVTDANGVPAMGGSGTIRIGQYLPYLNVDYVLGAPVFDWKRGMFGVHTLTNTDQFVNPDDLWDTRPEESDYVWDCDIIYLQRNMHVSMPEAIVTARKNGQIVINDIDDWFWDLHKDNVASRSTDPAIEKEYNRDHYQKALSVSSAVVASTPFIRDNVYEWNPRTYLIENHVNVALFSGDQRFGSDPIDDYGTVGWTGSTAHRSGDFEVLKPFAKQFEWTHLGDTPAHTSFAEMVGIEKSETIKLCPYEVYCQLFYFDVGVVPLNDIAFNHAKSNIKGLEYAAAGVPFVASKVGEYVRLRKNYDIGILARGRADWVRHLNRLMSTKSMRMEEAEKNWNNVHLLDVSVGAAKLEEFLTV